MGGADSKETSLDIFSAGEKENIHEIFSKISRGAKAVHNEQFKKSLPSWLEPHLRDRILTAILQCDMNKDLKHGSKMENTMNEIQFGRFLAEVLKGMNSEKAGIVTVLSHADSGEVLFKNLSQAILSITNSYLAVGKNDLPSKSWKCQMSVMDAERLSLELLSDVHKQDIVTRDDIERWISRSSLFLTMFDRIFREMFTLKAFEATNAPPKALLPLVSDVDWYKVTTLLSSASILFLNHHLPSTLQAEWRFLYSNHLYGDSFSQLVSHIVKKGPSVLVIKAKDGHVFGAFVEESWDLKAQFYGSSRSFLFSLSPKFGVYSSTGYNQNYMYLNQGQQTLPNGLGLGGQFDYFGLWIDQSFNVGHSKAVPKCTTYGSPQLSNRPEFEVDMVEVWAVGPPAKVEDEEEDEYAKKSVLDKDVEAKAILEMVGKKQVSEGLRDLEEDEEMSEEMKRKMNVIPKMF